MPVETATYITDLVPANPTHTDGLNQADSHLRLTKSVLHATFPSLNAPVTGTPTQLNQAAAANATAGSHVIASAASGASETFKAVAGSGDVTISNSGTNGAAGVLNVAVNDATNANPVTALTISQAGISAPSVMQAGAALIPRGVIVPYWGSLTAIPAGWLLCDGTNGTPDLRGQWLAGASTGGWYVGQTFGALSQTVSTASAGSHNHTGSTVAAGGHTHSGTTDTQGYHSHGGATAGAALTIDQTPAGYFELQNNGGGPFTLPAGSNIQVGLGSGNAHTHGINADGSHAHNLNVTAVGDHAHGIQFDGAHTHAVSVNTYPPTTCLIFIMKS